MKPTIGRIVHYIVSEDDCYRIRAERAGNGSRGNSPVAGNHLPAVVTAVWGDSLNLQVMLDGPAQYWVSIVHEGTTPGTWHWPEQGGTPAMLKSDPNPPGVIYTGLSAGGTNRTTGAYPPLIQTQSAGSAIAA